MMGPCQHSTWAADLKSASRGTQLYTWPCVATCVAMLTLIHITVSPSFLGSFNSAQSLTLLVVSPVVFAGSTNPPHFLKVLFWRMQTCVAQMFHASREKSLLKAVTYSSLRLYMKVGIYSPHGTSWSSRRPFSSHLDTHSKSSCKGLRL